MSVSLQLAALIIRRGDNDTTTTTPNNSLTDNLSQVGKAHPYWDIVGVLMPWIIVFFGLLLTAVFVIALVKGGLGGAKAFIGGDRSSAEGIEALRRAGVAILVVLLFSTAIYIASLILSKISP